MGVPTSYNVIFRGNIAEGQEKSMVKRSLAALFKVDESKIETLMFSGKPFVVKENVDAQTALNYQKAFKKAGGICQIVKVERDTNQVSSKTSTSMDALKPHAQIKQQPEQKAKPKDITPNNNHQEGILHMEQQVTILDSAIPSKPKKYRSKEEADADFQKIKQILPEKKTVYEPSGKTSVWAIILMILGIVPALAAGIIAGGIVYVITIILSVLLAKAPIGLAALAALIVLIAGMILSGVAYSISIGLMISAIGKIGKNRNQLIPSVISFIASFSAFFFIRILPIQGINSVGGTLLVMIFLIFSLIAAAASIISVGNQKFCEKTGKYLNTYTSKPFPLMKAPVFYDYITKDQFDLLAEEVGKYTQDSKGSKHHFLVNVFKVPYSRMAEGYIEANIHIVQKWIEKDSTKTREVNWMILSIKATSQKIDKVAKALKISIT